MDEVKLNSEQFRILMFEVNKININLERIERLLKKSTEYKGEENAQTKC